MEKNCYGQTMIHCNCVLSFVWRNFIFQQKRSRPHAHTHSRASLCHTYRRWEQGTSSVTWAEVRTSIITTHGEILLIFTRAVRHAWPGLLVQRRCLAEKETSNKYRNKRQEAVAKTWTESQPSELRKNDRKKERKQTKQQQNKVRISG